MGAATITKMAFIIVTISIMLPPPPTMKYGLMAFSIETLNTMVINEMTLSIVAFSIMALCTTFSVLGYINMTA